MSKISQSWQSEPSIFTNASSVKTTPPDSSYQLIDGSKEDYKKVTALFNRQPVPNFGISKVEVIYNQALEESFNCIVQVLVQKNQKTVSEEQVFKKPKELRESIYKNLKLETQPYSPSNLDVNLLPMFHGTHPALLSNIFKTGYNSPGNDYPGQLGLGIYHSSQASFAYRIHGCGALLLNWIAFTTAFPIVKSDLPIKKNPKYEVHYSLVEPLDPTNGKERIYYPIGKIDEDFRYNELAAFLPSQILPRYLVTLSPSGLNLKQLNPQFSKSTLFAKFIELIYKDQELSQPIQDELEIEQNDPNDQLTATEEWMLTHLTEILELKDVNPNDSQNLTEQLIHVLKINKRANIALKKSPNLIGDSPENEDYLKGLSLIRSDDQKNHSEAVQLFKSAASLGHAASSYELGNCYRMGKGVKQDDLFAFQFYLAAADKNHVEGQFQVGQCYKLGKGVGQNFEKAIEYTKSAAKKGHPGALDYKGHCYFNGYTLKQNYDKAFRCFTLAAEQGNESSQYYLANCYQNGFGVEKDNEGAFKMWKSLADGGNRGAQFEVGQCYKNGIGVEQNFLLAIRYSLLAANQGDVRAQEYIGHCYFQGYTFPQDFTLAFKYFQKGANQANPSSLEYLAICYADGKGTEKDIVLAAKYYAQAADLGMKQSQLAFGHACLEGIGVAKNLERAKYYLQLAADQGIKEAKDLLAELK